MNTIEKLLKIRVINRLYIIQARGGHNCASIARTLNLAAQFADSHGFAAPAWAAKIAELPPVFESIPAALELLL